MQRFQSGEYANSSEPEMQPTTSKSLSYGAKSLHLGEFNLNKEKSSGTYSTDDEKIQTDNEMDGQRIQLNIPIRFWSEPMNRPEDINAISLADDDQNNSDTESQMDNDKDHGHHDYSPKYEAPPPPDATKEVLHRVSMFKDMFILNTELFIKEKVPRLPSSLFDQKLDNVEIEPHAFSFDQTDGVVGVPLPTRKKMISGIEQDDIIGKSVAFTAWILFVIMRMLALSVFSVFYPEACVYLCFVHYLIMVTALLNETKFQEKIERNFFYLFLAYVYVFCILEFKIKFRKPRCWYIGYVSMVLVQNLSITLVWYLLVEFESWWFKYIFIIIMLSFCYCVLCLVVYVCLLKPRDKILFENEVEQ